MRCIHHDVLRSLESSRCVLPEFESSGALAQAHRVVRSSHHLRRAAEQKATSIGPDCYALSASALQAIEITVMRALLAAVVDGRDS
jgi:hypothetical protein